MFTSTRKQAAQSSSSMTAGPGRGRVLAQGAGVAALAGAVALMMTAGPASAKPATGTTFVKVPGVTLRTMWMNCNAAGGEYTETGSYALCTLPNGQYVFCTPTGCWMSTSSVVVPSRPVPPVVSGNPVIVGGY